MENTMIWDFVWRLVLAALFGTIIGLDREYREKEAGFRTHFLVSLGSALMMIVSQYGFSEILTHAAFYAGWPKAWAAFRLAKEVWTENCGTAEEFAKTSLFPVGEPNTAFGQYFTGNSYLKILSGKLGMTVANVTFEPRCRNNWHIHKAESGGGQILLCTEGEGWYQEWEKPARRLRSGDVVEIPAGIKHWHGAAKDKWFSHIALEVPGKGTSNEWLEPVSEKDYEKLK